MRIFLILIVLLSALTDVNATSTRYPTRSGTQKPTTSSIPMHRVPAGATNRTVGRQANLPSKPVFSDMSARCVRPGDLLNFSGNNLLALSDSKLVIKIDNSEITLKRLSISNTQLITQLPTDSRIQANHVYPVLLKKPDNLMSNQQTKLTLRICSFLNDNLKLSVSRNHQLGEILVLVDTIASDSVQQEIVKLGYKILQHHHLAGLDKVLLTLSVDEQVINSVISDLQTRFPNALIDLNDHYQPTAAPRTYASDMVAWPAIHPCSHYKDLTIGIIDGFVDQTHPALADQTITVKSFLRKSEQPDHQHGTAIAVILSGNKADFGFQGLLPGIKIMAASILSKNQNTLIATTEAIIRSIDWLIIQNVRLVNVSLSGKRANLIMKNVFERAIKNGLIIFSAAGNNGKAASKSYPAALSGVIAITAIDAAKRIYTQATHGNYIDFSAPGVDIWIIDHGIQGKYSSGTSYASPFALAVAALYLAENKSLSRDVLYNAMKERAHDLGKTGHDPVFGWGLVQAQPGICQ